jgi:ERCC4-related helicase
MQSVDPSMPPPPVRSAMQSAPLVQHPSASMQAPARPADSYAMTRPQQNGHGASMAPQPHPSAHMAPGSRATAPFQPTNSAGMRTMTAHPAANNTSVWNHQPAPVAAAAIVPSPFAMPAAPPVQPLRVQPPSAPLTFSTAAPPVPSATAAALNARAPTPYYASAGPPSVPSQPKVPLTDEQVREIVSRWNAQRVSTAPGGLFNPLSAEAASSFIYPLNKPERRYQREIVQTSFVDNTLVCLPTGLGKTLIAAVLMYNMIRWFPTGKVLFVAPTRPLVLQQKEACCNVMGIDESQTAVLISAGDFKDPLARRRLWEDNEHQRVIFATPQSITSDIENGRCALHRIVCLVVDEAHRAQKNYAYVNIVKRLMTSGHDCRIVGLTATPGDDLRAVKELCANLNISAIELRDESDPELQMHLHEREIEKCVVEQTNDAALDLLFNCMRPRLRTIVSHNININQTDPAAISPMILHKAVGAIGSRISAARMAGAKVDSSLWTIQGELGVMNRLITVRDKLKQHGVQPALDAIQQQIMGDADGQVPTTKGVKPPSPALLQLRHSIEFRKFYELLQNIAQQEEYAAAGMMMERDAAAASAAWHDDAQGGELDLSDAAAAAAKLPLGVHAKVRKLVELILQHFAHVAQKERWTSDDAAAGAGESDSDDEDESILSLSRGTSKSSAAPCLVFSGSKSQSNVIVFTELRDSVEEIVKNLERFAPTIRAAAFIGQAKKVGGKLGMNQKAQAEVLKKFRQGSINVMSVSTVELSLRVMSELWPELTLLLCFLFLV